MLLRIRPAMFRARPLSFLALWLLVTGGAIGAVVLASMALLPWALLAGAGGAVAALVLAAWWLRKLGARLTITTWRTIETTGLFSKATTEVRHEDVKNLQIRQTFLQRLTNVGEIGLSSSAQDDIEIVMTDVPRPYEVRDVIDRYRRVPPRD